MIIPIFRKDQGWQKEHGLGRKLTLIAPVTNSHEDHIVKVKPFESWPLERDDVLRKTKSGNLAEGPEIW